ncbi:Uncharacterised protein [Streptococcus pneumoniae]|nr:Uncharacterised protein [Streptococcus pneumoniae]
MDHGVASLEHLAEMFNRVVSPHGRHPRVVRRLGAGERDDALDLRALIRAAHLGQEVTSEDAGGSRHCHSHAVRP